MEELLALVSTLPLTYVGPPGATAGGGDPDEYRILLAEDDEVVAKQVIYRFRWRAPPETSQPPGTFTNASAPRCHSGKDSEVGENPMSRYP